MKSQNNRLMRVIWLALDCLEDLAWIRNYANLAKQTRQRTKIKIFVHISTETETSEEKERQKG